MNRKTGDSSRRAGFILGSALATALLLATLAGCRSTDASSPTRYVLATTLAGYHIHASLDRAATIEPHDDHALISFGQHRLRIEKGRVVLDDNETAAFPIGATHIAIEVARGTLRVTADGQEIWRKPFPGE